MSTVVLCKETSLLSLNLGAVYFDPCCTLFILLEAFLSSILNTRLSGDNLLNLLMDGLPVLEDCKWDVFFDTVGD